jgi:hypothetical protein
MYASSNERSSPLLDQDAGRRRAHRAKARNGYAQPLVRLFLIAAISTRTTPLLYQEPRGALARKWRRQRIGGSPYHGHPHRQDRAGGAVALHPMDCHLSRLGRRRDSLTFSGRHCRARPCALLFWSYRSAHQPADLFCRGGHSRRLHSGASWQDHRVIHRR